MSLSPTTAPSFVGDGLSMSKPSSTPSIGASELGRLDLTGPGSSCSSNSDMVVSTRAMAKKTAEQQQQPKQASSGRQGRVERRLPKVTASSSSATSRATRHQPPRQSKATASASQRQGEDDDGEGDDDVDDDDDDDDEDGDDNDDSSDNDPPPPAADWRQDLARNVLEIFSAFEPNQFTFSEMTSSTAPAAESSVLYRGLAAAVCRLVRSEADLQILRTAIPVPGPQWSRVKTSNIERRCRTLQSEFHLYRSATINRQAPPQGTDVVGTIPRIVRLCLAVENTLTRFPQMANGTPQRLVDIFAQLFEFLVANASDIRGDDGAVYAGGATNFEHNLYFSFAAIHAHHFPCLEAMRRLGERGYKPQFRHCLARWKGVFLRMRRNHYVEADGSWHFPRESMGFFDGLQQRLLGMGVEVP